jgi:hypothetical protein
LEVELLQLQVESGVYVRVAYVCMGVGGYLADDEVFVKCRVYIVTEQIAAGSLKEPANCYIDYQGILRDPEVLQLRSTPTG